MVLESGGWTMYDTAAGALALLFLSGYHLAPIQQLLVAVLSVVFGPLGVLLPGSVFFFGLAGVTGLSSTILRHVLQDTAQRKRLRSRLTELQEELSTAEENDNISPQLQQEFLHGWTAMMKLQFRPVVWSMLVTVPIFLWLRWAMAAPMAAAVPVALTLPVVGPVAMSATFVGPLKMWFAWYLGGSITTSVVSKRVLSLTA